ncbi:hypothetical protein [Thermococcus sp. Bubb.Bath]|uniref:hypothetical protein n=1 Tax=Thermococcus sp. Bubb.Bath TaxID=1638242 RepID=UPI00143B1090|nr:hypothetical protein [Thermococcus sp. Bubb.Bath]
MEKAGSLYLASDAFFTYELRAKSLPVADLKFVQEISSRLPPQVQKALNPVLEQISVNWVANWVKELGITYGSEHGWGLR